MIKKLNNKARSAVYRVLENVMYSPKKNKFIIVPNDDTHKVYFSDEWEYIGPYNFNVENQDIDQQNEDKNG